MELDLTGLHPDEVEDFMLIADRIQRDSDARRAQSGDPGTPFLIGFDPIAGRVVCKGADPPPNRDSDL